MEQKVQKSPQENSQQKPQQQPVPIQSSQPATIVQGYYKSLAPVRMTFKMQQVYILKLDNYKLVLPPQTKMIQVKRIVDDISKKSFNFYLKDSFLPNLNSKIGDLAQCYASISERKDFYG